MASSGYDGSIRINTQIDTRGIDTGINDVNRQLNNGASSINNSSKKLTNSFNNISRSILRIVSIASLIKLGGSSIKIASDLQEVQNVVDVSFGDMANTMNKFSRTALETYGLSELSAKKIGSSFASMANGMGFAQDSVSNMSIELTKLSADIGSFYNVSNEEARIALASIFTGETETLKRYGILITEVNLQEYARQQGITKSIEAMTQQEKVMLRYNYVMNATKQAQGDFARTYGSWANQTRVLTEKFKQLLTILGQGLIAVLTPAIKMLNMLMSYLIDFSNTLGSVLTKLFGIDMKAITQASGGAVMSDLATGADEASEAIAGIGDATKKADKEIKKTVGDYDELKIINKSVYDNADATGSLGKIGGISPTQSISIDDSGLNNSANNVSGTLGKLKDVLSDFTKYCSANFGPTIKDVLKDTGKNFKNFEKILGNVRGDVRTLGAPLKKYLTNDFTPFLKSYIKHTGTVLNGLFDTFNIVFYSLWDEAIFPSMQTGINTILPLITQFATEYYNTLSVVFTDVKTVFDTMWTEGVIPELSLITYIWSDIWSTMYAVWNEYGVTIFSNIRSMINSVTGLVMELWSSFVKPVVDNVIACLKKLWDEHLQALLKNLIEFFSQLFILATDFYNKFIWPIYSWLIDILGPVFSSVFNAIYTIVSNNIGGIVDEINGVVTVANDVVKFLTDVFKGDWEAAWTDIKDTLADVWDLIVDVVKNPINLIIGFINGMIDAMETAINFVIKGVNELSFKVPDWVPKIGGNKFGFDMSQVSFSNVPYLATGAVLPANNPFLAVVGDQTRGTNIEAPADLIKQMAKEAIEEAGGGAGNINVNVILEGDASGMLHVLKTEVVKEQAMHPNKPVWGEG